VAQGALNTYESSAGQTAHSSIQAKDHKQKHKTRIAPGEQDEARGYGDTLSMAVGKSGKLIAAEYKVFGKKYSILEHLRPIPLVPLLAKRRWGRWAGDKDRVPADQPHYCSSRLGAARRKSVPEK